MIEILVSGGVMHKEQETVEVDCKVVHRTANATLIDDGQTDKQGKPIHVWIPNSQIVRWIKDGKDKITGVELPVWLATDKGLV